MQKVLINSILLIVFVMIQIQPVAAKQIQVKAQNSGGIISCFSGGQEILRKEVVSGPFADEYKFAHEVTVRDGTKEYNLNFTGGLCIIDRGEISLAKELAISDRLICYSGMVEVASFEVHGRETTVDEYVEGRTFLATAKGVAFNKKALSSKL